MTRIALGTLVETLIGAADTSGQLWVLGIVEFHTVLETIVAILGIDAAFLISEVAVTLYGRNCEC